MYQQRTPVENPYCGRQLATQEPIAPVSWGGAFGWRLGQCPDCGRLVNLRANGTTKIHKVYGRGEMARRIAEYKRTGEL